MQTATDEALMGQVRDGDLRKLALLFERHHKRLYNLFLQLNADRDLSEDLVQEVFFRILRYRQSYDESRPFTTWLYQVARNLNTERLNARKGELRLVTTDDPDTIDLNQERRFEPVSSALSADDALRRKQEIGLLRRALLRLPEEKREVLVLSRFQQLKYEQIGELLGCEAGAVKVRVYRAIRALSTIYQELAGEKAS